ncbi:protein translocase subunit SecD [Streptomyces sp. NBS 14/10]|uniref:protein translocase subunit SecD n=1 Tax=Streptomyces sp. NBS 14/10 TaxID=1945643 RepID=UPI000B7D9961|nr:protein translocase subunit SecD [Streptomyces sp. NBS 14/10]KAK1183413.1 protein translocase subunit SecD [Streptomyces sp. NBS 14/10]NUS87435.1 protein translocase subunit SecD [Streptomyces sp.]
MAAPKKGRRSSGSQGRPGRALVAILVAIVALTAGMFISGHTKPRLGIDLAGGTSFTLEAKNQPGKPNAINSDNMNTAVNIIERRVNGLGVSEAEVQTQGDKHIIVNIPKGMDAKQARTQVGTTAQLYFRPVVTYTDGKKTKPTTSPTPTATGTGKNNNKGDDKGKASSTPTATATSGATGTPSGSSASSSSQGRAVSEGLKADKTPSASESPSASSSPKASETPKATETPKGDSAKADDLTKQLADLECTTPADRAKAREKAAGAKPGDSVVACDRDGTRKFILGPSQVEGTDVKDAASVYDSQGGGGWIVELNFTGKGGKKWAKVTGELAKQQPPQNQFAIVLDGEVYSDPRVDESIVGGRAQISGPGFDQKNTSDLANVLSYGALPLSFDIADETTVSAALGGEQLEAGLIAGAIGLALVVVYLVVYYRGLALIALASLAVSAVLSYTIMVLLGPGIGFALNLPAVCGAIVAIGITADSFIVYFERIRDEIREGRTLRPAVERGWPRARRTILVSDFVSFLAAAVLYIVTVGKVQGFAFTLGLTTLLDVVVVFLFTKPLMTILARRKFFASGHPWSGLDPRRLGAKPPLRRSRRSTAPAPADPKEA